MDVEPTIISLDGESAYPLSETIMLEGPLLVKAIPKGVTIVIHDGHPAEAASRVVCRFTNGTLAPGGAWVPRGAFVVAATPLTEITEIRASVPTPYVVVLQANADSEGFTERTLRTLGRLDVYPMLENGGTAGGNVRRLVVEVPLRSYRRLQDAASVLGCSITPGTGSSSDHTDVHH
jgi:hypothetical protein